MVNFFSKLPAWGIAMVGVSFTLLRSQILDYVPAAGTCYVLYQLEYKNGILNLRYG